MQGGLASYAAIGAEEVMISSPLYQLEFLDCDFICLNRSLLVKSSPSSSQIARASR